MAACFLRLTGGPSALFSPSKVNCQPVKPHQNLPSWFCQRFLQDRVRSRMKISKQHFNINLFNLAMLGNGILIIAYPLNIIEYKIREEPEISLRGYLWSQSCACQLQRHLSTLGWMHLGSEVFLWDVWDVWACCSVSFQWLHERPEISWKRNKQGKLKIFCFGMWAVMVFLLCTYIYINNMHNMHIWYMLNIMEQFWFDFYGNLWSHSILKMVPIFQTSIWGWRSLMPHWFCPHAQRLSLEF